MKGKLLTVRDCESLSLDEVKAIYKKNVSPSLTEILDSFSFSQETIESAEGVWLKTRGGRKILDVTGGAGVLNLGHNPPSILSERIKFQQEKRSEVHKSFFSPYLAALSHNISMLMPGELNYSYFCNSGAEAVEGALKASYKYHSGKRDVVLHSDIAFHGKLLATGNLTATPGKTFKFQSVIKHDAFIYDDVESLRRKVQEYKGSVYAIIVEAFSATHLKGLSPAFLKELRKFCDEYDIVLICDEIYTGWYKTGPMLAFMSAEISPDIVTISKSLGGGKATISAYVSSDKVMKRSYSKVKEALLHSTTYNGYAEECITAIESLNLLQKPEIAEGARRLERKFHERADQLKNKYPHIIERYSGRGALQGIYFRNDGTIKEKILGLLPTEMIMGEHFVEKLMIAGVIDHLFEKHDIHSLFMVAGAPSLLFTPSLILRDDEADIFFDALDKTLAVGTWNLVIEFVKKKLLKKISG